VLFYGTSSCWQVVRAPPAGSLEVASVMRGHSAPVRTVAWGAAAGAGGGGPRAADVGSLRGALLTGGEDQSVRCWDVLSPTHQASPPDAVLAAPSALAPSSVTRLPPPDEPSLAPSVPPAAPPSPAPALPRQPSFPAGEDVPPAVGAVGPLEVAYHGVSSEGMQQGPPAELNQGSSTASHVQQPPSAAAALVVPTTEAAAVEPGGDSASQTGAPPGAQFRIRTVEAAMAGPPASVSGSAAKPQPAFPPPSGSKRKQRALSLGARSLLPPLNCLTGAESESAEVAAACGGLPAQLLGPTPAGDGGDRHAAAAGADPAAHGQPGSAGAAAQKFPVRPPAA
jgi:hypothetical protein